MEKKEWTDHPDRFSRDRILDQLSGKHKNKSKDPVPETDQETTWPLSQRGGLLSGEEDPGVLGESDDSGNELGSRPRTEKDEAKTELDKTVEALSQSSLSSQSASASSDSVSK